MPRIIRWSPRRTKIAQKTLTNQPNPKGNESKNDGFGYWGCLSSEGGAELCCGVSACTAGLWSRSPAPCEGTVHGIWGFSDASFGLP